MWREAHLRALNAPQSVLNSENELQFNRVVVAEAGGVDREVLVGALFAVVVKDVAWPSGVSGEEERNYSAAAILLERHGIDVKLILDVIYKKTELTPNVFFSQFSGNA